MSNITQIPDQVESGDLSAAESLLPLVYDDLRRLARARMRNERVDHTLQATALVHEAYLRLVGTDRVQRWESQSHFFAAAAEAMRRVLIDSARQKQAAKRSGSRERAALSGDVLAGIPCSSEDLLDVNELLEKLDAEDPETAQFVKLRLFAGLSTEECGRVLGWSRATAFENWRFVQAWFARHLSSPSE